MFTVLDHGYVKLTDVWGSDETIIEAARMSTGKGFKGWGTADEPGDEKLLAYLYNNRHTTPFEQCGLTVEVQAPLMVFREWHRHRTQSYNEFSARYAVMPDVHYLPILKRVQPKETSNKQAQSTTEYIGDGRAQEWLNELGKLQREIYAHYQQGLRLGIPKEIARLNTPLSRYSKMRASANLLNWLRFLGLRLPENAQWEIRQYAEAIGKIIETHFPRTWELFTANKL